MKQLAPRATDPDERAVKILSTTFWSPSGWNKAPAVSAEDLAYAKSRGVMFDLVSMPHDEAVRSSLEAVAGVSRDGVARAFVSSLGSRRLDLRSALGSYAVGRHMQDHPRQAPGARAPCGCCGLYEPADDDPNILNFERIKWGGVRHGDPQYIALDLRLFASLDPVSPRPEDVAILHAILDIVRSVPLEARPNDLERALTGVLPSNREERRTLIEILGLAGLLVDPERPDVRRSFVRSDEREHTFWSKDDWSYPVRWWTGACGLDEAAADEWFGMV